MQNDPMVQPDDFVLKSFDYVLLTFSEACL